MGYLHSFKVPPRKKPFNYREEKTNFILEKPDRYQLNHVTDVTIIRIGINQNDEILGRGQGEEGQVTAIQSDIPATDA